MIRTRLPILLLMFLVAFVCAGCGAGSTPVTAEPTTPAQVAATPTPTRDPGRLANDAQSASLLPSVASRATAVAAALQSDPPILPLSDALSSEQALAQTLALANPEVIRSTRAGDTGAPLRTEVFGIYPVRASDITEATTACQLQTCYRVELYNYAYNSTTVAIVNVTDSQVLAVNDYAETQPDLPQELVTMAVQIAVNAPEVAQELGETPQTDAATMANMKTALNRTLCERSRHLCVAPTFLQGDRALWAIVDLTDAKLVGVRWTDLGPTQSPPITEKTLQNEAIYADFCNKTTELSRDGWEMNYILTSSDGLRISEVRYQGKAVLDSAKLVDYHVSYSKTEGFGYSDAIGCPIFSQAAVIAFAPPQVEELVENGKVTGFSLIQDFRSELWPQPCNYRYEQRYNFYADGRFDILASNYGRGCGNDGFYRLVMRIAPSGVASFARWDGRQWVPWREELWAQEPPDTEITAEGYLYRIAQKDQQEYSIAPYWDSAERRNSALMYVTARHLIKDEGDADLITIGPCCNDDYRQGPEKFIEPDPEPLTETPIVLWYVPVLKNDDTPGSEYCWADWVLEDGVYTTKTWRCQAGLQFSPVKASQ